MSRVPARVSRSGNIGRGVHLGANATALAAVQVADDATLGASACVEGDVCEGALR